MDNPPSNGLAIKFINPNYGCDPRATIHRTGRLYFNKDAVQFMGLNKRPSYYHPSFYIAVDGEERPCFDEPGATIFLLEDYTMTGEDYDFPPTLRSNRSGETWYMEFKNICDQLGINFANHKYVFEVRNHDKDNQFELVLYSKNWRFRR